MRLYVFSNMYLSPIQHGIQGLHSMGEMVLKYPTSSKPGKRFRTWLRDHKTVIVLKGGYSSVLSCIDDALSEIASADPGLPFAFFREEGLEDAITSVSVVVGEASYNPSGNIEEEYGDSFLIKQLLEQFDGDSVAAAQFGRHYSPEVRLAALCKGFPLA